MNTNPLRIGLVGYGFAGQTFHAPVLTSVPGLQLVAVASSRPERVRADWPGVAVESDAAALCDREDVDLVVIAAPNDVHHPLAARALDAGKHVVVDKPFVLDAAQARELINALRDAGALPVGLAYAVWTGIGSVGAFVTGIAAFGEDSSPARILVVTGLVAALVALKLVSGGEHSGQVSDGDESATGPAPAPRPADR